MGLVGGLVGRLIGWFVRMASGRGGIYFPQFHLMLENTADLFSSVFPLPISLGTSTNSMKTILILISC